MNEAKPQVFCWHELLTDDPEKAVDFYAAVCGWEPDGRPMKAATGTPYHLLKQGEVPVAGVMARPRPEAPGAWDGYVSVPDLDAALEKVTALGGRSVLDEPMRVEGWGRFGYVLDPQGGGLGLVQLEPQIPNVPNAGVDWNEYVARDAGAALAFYRELFGWEVVEEMPTPSGPYRILGYSGDRTSSFGALYASADEPPGWRYYLHVERLAPALKAAQERGATIVMGPHEVPGGTFVAIGVDPQGVGFALHAPQR